MTAYYQSQEQAYDMIVGDGAKVFDLSQEKDESRDRYGLRWVGNSARSTFGQCCLVARRLVERGVPFITINYLGWDTHKSHFQARDDKGDITDIEGR